ncbi:MAG: hypothetical protein KUG61_07885 [Parvibaculaceae bacterium]|nr:hypothetical protein [Parvibaculaceae bacterium]
MAENAGGMTLSFFALGWPICRQKAPCDPAKIAGEGAFYPLKSGWKEVVFS